MFDADGPILRGSCFDLYPTWARIARNDVSEKALLLGGHHENPSYDWVLRVEASDRSPLIKFRLSCFLKADMTLPDPQPSAVLCMSASPEVTIDQGTESIYVSTGIPRCYGFPAAYLWRDGMEAVIFFNMTPSTWMATDGLCRFQDAHVGTRAVGNQSTFGLQCDKLTGSKIRAGDMILEFYLYSSQRPVRPSKLVALDTMIRVCAPLHPSTSIFPKNHADGGEVSWSQFARKATNDLMHEGRTYARIDSDWSDSPLSLVQPSKTMIVHPGHIASKPEQAQNEWDFSTVNNHLSAWELYSRLNPNADQQRLLAIKKDALPRFYDSKAGIIRWGTRQPAHVGDMEMTWQNLYFHLETVRTYEALPPSEFNPAIAGRFLMATRGLIDFAHRVDYVFPQWFNPYEKTPIVQNDVKSLGAVREPWQVGSYAYLMMRAYRITGEAAYRKEAATAIRKLFSMRYTVHNDVYTRSYSDPVDFPITELFGNAYGAVAANQLYEATHDKVYLRYSRDFLNTLLRLTPWYEDETDPISHQLRSAGLFYPHCGASVATPWETIEANLCIASVLKHDVQSPIYDLLLRLSNLNRIDSFYFHPAACSNGVLSTRERGLGQYFPFEPFYCLEGTGGHRGDTAAYMSGISMWNYWLYEALAEATDRDVMVLNLDALENYQEAVSGVARHFVIYNPGSAKAACRVIVRNLPDGAYSMSIGSTKPQRVQCTKLRAGIPLVLAPGEHISLTITRASADADRSVAQWRAARDQLSSAYARLQECSVGDRASIEASFASAMADYRKGSFASAAAKAGALSPHIGPALHQPGKH